jgi:(E)-4-hydroxy-3-methylbut-2-enyl-diphosphate synthase
MTDNKAHSHIVQIGHIPLGGEHPVRLQSMTNTNTADTKATVEQIKRIAGAGADYVRMTTRSIKEAQNLKNIKEALRAEGNIIPLIADVHFNPRIAEIAAEIVDKVRINPGNYAEIKSTGKTKFSNKEFKEGIDNIRLHLNPLLDICKAHHTAIRLGVNHGSLSPRIMDRYGNTPEGMVESVMEYLNICLENDFKHIVVSIKSSNTQVMIQANRLLAKRMAEENIHYPIHLGVTEAGEGENGRIKSAIGIGTLLKEGIGDTIRVSLTEPPEDEIPFARKLADYAGTKDKKLKKEILEADWYDPLDLTKRPTAPLGDIGGAHPPVVISDYYTSPSEENHTKISTLSPDYVYEPEKLQDIATNKPVITDFEKWEKHSAKDAILPLFHVQEYIDNQHVSNTANFILLNNTGIDNPTIQEIKSKASKHVYVVDKNAVQEEAKLRSFFENLHWMEDTHPVILKKIYNEVDNDDLIVKSSVDIGAWLVDGLVDGVWISNKAGDTAAETTVLSFGLLQASRLRMSQPEYISCPSCGRTLFDIQKMAEAIRKRTSHLKGLKIAIMGCIVNGPGEMADADYGYVGAAPGKITLYKDRQPVKKNIPENHAVDELINLIKENGDWVE